MIGAKRTLVTVGLLVLLFAPNANAVSPETLRGTIQFANANLTGDTSATSDQLTAAFLTSETLNRLEGSFTLNASEAVVNWTHQVYLGVGSTPNDPGSSIWTHRTQNQSREARYSDASLSSLIQSENADLLMLASASGALRFHASGASRLRTEAAQDEKWAAGLQGQNFTTADPNDEGFLIETYRLTTGQPVFRSESGIRWEAQGDMVLYVWGADVTVTDSAGRDTTFRSGAWRENETGPAAREEHAQFLRITLTHATLALQHDVGSAQWTAPESTTHTEGTVQYSHASGLLESALHLYDLRDESFQIVGTVNQRVTNAEKASDVRSIIDAPDSQTNLDPSVVVPAPAGNNGPAALLWVLFALVVASGLAAGGWFRVRRYRAYHMELDDLVKRADTALVEERFGEAVRWSRVLVARKPTDVQAWWLWGTSLLRRYGPERAIRALEPVTLGLARPAPAAFILGWAYLYLGRTDAANRWLREAAKDPAFADYIGVDPKLLALHPGGLLRSLIPCGSEPESR